MELYVTILAAGLGKRMNSDLPKVLHLVNGVPMIIRLLRQAILLKPSKIIIVVGKFKNIIDDTIKKYNINANIEFAIQNNPLGTAHAVLCALDHYTNDQANVIIINGDNPMLTFNTINDILTDFINKYAQLQLTTLNSPNPTGSGRVILNDSKFVKIIEEKDCTDEQRKNTLINCGIYIAKAYVLKKCIPFIKNKNAQNEFYLTDIGEVYQQLYNQHVNLFSLPETKYMELININTREQLEQLNLHNK